MRLSKLPTELLVEVSLYLNERQKSILSRVCKEIRPAVLPSLYKSLEWNFDTLYSGPYYPGSSGWDRHREFSIWLLVRSILEKPQLGRLVEHVHFVNEAYPRSKDFELVETLLLPYETQIRSNPKHDYNDSWIKNLSRGYSPSFVTLLLGLAPNLKTLELAHKTFIDANFLYLIEKSVILDKGGVLYKQNSPGISKLSFLSQLRSAKSWVLRDHGFRDDFYPGDEAMVSFIGLPKLSNLEGHIVPEDSSHVTRPKQSLPLSMSLEHLTFRNTPEGRSQTNIVHSMLKSAPNLKYLRLEYDFTIKFFDVLENDDDQMLLDLNQLGLALNHVASSLESLVIFLDRDTESKVELYLPNCGIMHMLPSLKHFQQLERLEVLFVVLFGFDDTPESINRLRDILPSSLKHLHLRDDLAWQDAYKWTPKDWLRRLETLLAKKQKTVPHLVTLELELSDQPSGWQHERYSSYGSTYDSREREPVEKWRRWGENFRNYGVSVKINGSTY